MTMQTTTIQSETKGVRTLIGGAAASLTMLGGTLLWQAQQNSVTVAPSITSGSTTNTGVAADDSPPFGVPAFTDGTGHSIIPPQAFSLRVAMDGMAGPGAEQDAATSLPDVTVPALTDRAGHFLTEQHLAAARRRPRGGEAGNEGATVGLAGSEAAPQQDQ